MSDDQERVVVVGSGFGGSVMAYRLVAAGRRVLLLERGRAFPPASFPRTPTAMRANFWRPADGLYGLFDVKSFRTFEAVVAAGLGGGSLIYANVLLRKPETWFAGWPLGRKDLDPHYDKICEQLGVTTFPADAPEVAEVTKSHEFLRAAAEHVGAAPGRSKAEPAPLAVTFGANGRVAPGARIPDPDAAALFPGVQRHACRLCGECDIGCQAGSKNTLDLTYLARAQARYRDNLEISTECEVRALRRDRHGWEVRYLQRGSGPRAVRAGQVVLAAGTFGSTELMLRAARAGQLPRRLPALGRRFSGNGDILGFVFDDTPEGRLRAYPGPVVTSYLEVEDAARGFYIQDAGYPEFLDWLIGTLKPSTARELGAFLSTLFCNWLRRRLVARSRSVVYDEMRALMRFAERSADALPLLGLGCDRAHGTMRLGLHGALDVRWDPSADKVYLAQVQGAMRELAKALDGRLASEPRFFHRRWITVHPLGGCTMGESARDSVVDPVGAVHGAPGLYVVDGSVMPGPVGANPSLTIAAFANRAASAMLDLSLDDPGP
jgi:cholesterol oxidase